MFDVTNFLVRWLFLSNLVRDVAEIQTLPYNPQAAQIQPHHQPPHVSVNSEDEWKDKCLRGILSYPPGTQRLLVMDAMRQELVEQLTWSLHRADQVLHQYETARRHSKHVEHPPNVDQGEDDDPFLDADLEILRAFEEETLLWDTDSADGGDGAEQQTGSQDRKAVLVIANNNTDSEQDEQIPPPSPPSKPTGVVEEPVTAVSFPEPEDLEDAQRTIRTVRDYLPQLVSILLRSPPAFEPHLLNPIEKLRRLVIRRCVEDANWGVDVCWLLEAEVGRAWKTLFEHRQQTGRRLIVVLPAEKAAVLAKIGTEKREAFDLLQDTEQATAYGYTQPLDDDFFYTPQDMPHNPQDGDIPHEPSRLPSSLSLRRCSHFGDTMHFIDMLTRISMDMQQVPIVHRKAYLEDRLKEINRRLRRRMVTLGDVSLDVEDNLGPDDWPHISDVTTEMLGHSVHLPLDPRQNVRWPGGCEPEDLTDGGAVRVLNVVVEECRTLSSRERCPFLVHLEVSETGLSGDDSRLYAAGAPGLGATVEEALSMSTASAMAGAANSAGKGNPTYQIPSELLDVSLPENLSSGVIEDVETNATAGKVEVLRGGWQNDETAYYSQQPHEALQSNPYDDVRQNQYEELHQQMYHDPGVHPPHHEAELRDPLLHTGEALLYKVFGRPWHEKCEEIRQSSPYGKTKGWRLASFIMKAGEDIRRESLVMQIVVKLNEWFQTEISEPLRPHMRPYTIMCVGGDAGLVECLSDAKSIDEVKKQTDNFVSLRDYFERAYGPPTAHSAQYMNMKTGSQSSGSQQPLSFEQAQDNFLRSLVGYSLVCYVLQIKDRHNANILLDRRGNIMHIDFGYVLGDSPKMAKVPIFSERAPFKLSGEFWDVLGGWDVQNGGLGVRFCHMFETAFACAASHTEEIVSLVEATTLTLTQSPRQARQLANSVRSRLKMRGPPGSTEQKAFIMELINAALTSWGTSTYDWLQKNMNGYQ